MEVVRLGGTAASLLAYARVLRSFMLYSSAFGAIRNSVQTVPPSLATSVNNCIKMGVELDQHP